MSVPSFNSSHQTAGTRTPELVSGIDDPVVDKCEHDMRNIRVDSLTVNRFASPFLERRQVSHETGCCIMNVTRRGMKKVKHGYTLLSKKPAEVIGSSLIGLGCSGLDT